MFNSGTGVTLVLMESAAPSVCCGVHGFQDQVAKEFRSFPVHTYVRRLLFVRKCDYNALAITDFVKQEFDPVTVCHMDCCFGHC